MRKTSFRTGLHPAGKVTVLLSTTLTQIAASVSDSVSWL